jgi:predicted acylesterase/phospholipase RssA
VNTWSDVFLGVIAVATLAIAVAQIAVIVAAGRLARRLERLTDELEREVKPLFGHLDAIGRDAARAAALATVQVERADRMFADIAGRIEQALNSLQTTLGRPASEGRALLSAFKAAIQTVREFRHNARPRQGRGEDEDALFI